MLTQNDGVDVTPWVERLVAHLKEAGAIRTPAVENAFRRVPRHRLLEYYFGATEQGSKQITCNPGIPDPEILDHIYSDIPLVTRLAALHPEVSAEMRVALQKLRGGGEESSKPPEAPGPILIPSSSTSQPGLVAGMLALLELAPGMKVLEIGAGTGYNAALMAEIIGDPSRIVAVDIQEDVIAQAKRLLTELGYGEIKLLVHDGFMGAIDDAPFDRIVATVGCADLTPHWIAQLKPDGFLLIPLMFGAWDPLVKVWREGSQLKGKMVANAGFMPIQGELHQTGYWWFLRGMSLPLDRAEKYPPFAGFELMALRDFYDFALILDQRTFWNFNPDACGLYDKDRGFILARDTGEILLMGEHKLYDDLYMLHQQWEALGKPQRGDYDLEFLPLTQAPPPMAERKWIIERKFYRQVFALPESV